MILPSEILNKKPHLISQHNMAGRIMGERKGRCWRTVRGAGGPEMGAVDFAEGLKLLFQFAIFCVQICRAVENFQTFENVNVPIFMTHSDTT